MATTFSLEQGPPSSFKLQHSSPLDTLVRRTSAKRARAAVQSTASQQYPAHLIDDYASTPDSQVEEDDNPYGGYSQELSLTPSRHPPQPQQQPLNSPLLHGHFARNSTATASINGSYTDTRISVDSRSAYQELEYRYHDADSVYSQNDPTSPAIRDSWRSGTSSGTVRPYDPEVNIPISNYSNPKPGLRLPTASPQPTSQWTSTVPTVVVSSADVDSNVQRGGRAPVVRPITSNFSRPVRPSASQQVTTPPPLPPNSEEQKRRVLERNANRTPSQSPSQLPPQDQQQMKFFRRSKSPTPNPYLSTASSLAQQIQPQSATFSSPEDPLPNPYADSSTTKPLKINKPSTPSPLNQSPNNDTVRISTPSYQPSNLWSDQHSPQPLVASQVNGNPNPTSHLAPVALPRHPPTRSDSPASLYSAYSYYNYESAVPSPVGSEFSGPTSRASPVPRPSSSQLQNPKPTQPSPLQNSQRSRSPNHNQSPSSGAAEPQTPQDFLQLGIQNHEANRLRESAMYFEKSAKENGGCGVGMLMWGLTLRHGWGCEKNEKIGFKWLRKAAENAVVDLESARGGKGVDTGPVQDELVLAIYEVGQCFFHGWGVGKDQKMAVSYYTVAARLGDPDAQNDLAFCLANGKGCKKDRKEAAKWYRAAVAQGASDVGLAWIYKEKFM